MKDTKQELKDIFAENLKHYLRIYNKTQADLCYDLDFTSSTVSDWITAKKYPRMDKVQMIADYFDIKKSDLTEKHIFDKNEPELILISRAMKKMDEDKKNRMMTILKASFMEEFNDN